MKLSSPCHYCGVELRTVPVIGGTDFVFRHVGQMKPVREVQVTEWARGAKSLAHEVSLLFHPETKGRPEISITLPRFVAAQLHDALHVALGVA